MSNPAPGVYIRPVWDSIKKQFAGYAVFSVKDGTSCWHDYVQNWHKPTASRMARRTARRVARVCKLDFLGVWPEDAE